ncbi:MAG: flippase-like domain-containing protein [Anaerolineales bacterium]|nr:flippase-like domain-containing protein [Anaerolineales bacterium]
MSDFATGSSRQNALRAIGTLLSLALLIYLLSQQGWDEIAAAFQQIAGWRLALAFGLMLVSRLAVAGRWHVLLRSGGVKIPFLHSLKITLAGLFATNFLPTTIGGDVVRLAGAIRYHYDAAICTAALIVDRLVGMTGMVMAAPFSLPALLQPHPVQPAVLLSSISISSGKWWQKLWRKGQQLIQRMLQTLSLWFHRPYDLLLSLGFSWAHMLCVFAILQLFLTGLGERLSFWLIAGLYSLVYFVTLIPFSINGYGLQEISMTLVFSTLGGASRSSGLTVALLYRTLMMVASLPGVLFLPGMLSAAKKSAAGSGHDDPQLLQGATNQDDLQ